MSRRTTHSAQQGGRLDSRSRPYVDETNDKWQTASRRQAEFSDHDDRAAWGAKFKSAYAHIIMLPDKVAPGDKSEARAILGRIEYCMEQKGKWTRNEWSRLVKMRDAWEARATGADVGFLLRGWAAQGDGQHLSSTEKFIKQFKSSLEELG